MAIILPGTMATGQAVIPVLTRMAGIIPFEAIILIRDTIMAIGLIRLLGFLHLRCPVLITIIGDISR